MDEKKKKVVKCEKRNAKKTVLYSTTNESAGTDWCHKEEFKTEDKSKANLHWLTMLSTL